MKKISSLEIETIKTRGDFYCFNPFYLHERCYVEKCGDELLTKERDPINNGWDYLYLPQDPEKIKGKNYIYLCDKDIERIKKLYRFKYLSKIGEEYVYSINGLIDLKGPEYRKLRKAINRFEKKYSFKVLNDYPEKACLELLDQWKNNKNLEEYSPDQKLFFDISYELNKQFIKNRDKVEHLGIYIEIEGKLAGFRLATKINDEVVVGVMQKVDYKYEGIAKYLYYLTAKSFYGTKYLTIGTGTMVDGIVSFKESLRPHKKIPLYYATVG